MELYPFICGIYILTVLEFILKIIDGYDLILLTPFDLFSMECLDKFSRYASGVNLIWIRILTLKAGLLCFWVEGVTCLTCSMYLCMSLTWRIERVGRGVYPAWGLDQYSLVRVRFEPRLGLVWLNVAMYLFVSGGSFLPTKNDLLSLQPMTRPLTL